MNFSGMLPVIVDRCELLLYCFGPLWVAVDFIWGTLGRCGSFVDRCKCFWIVMSRFLI